MLKKGWGYHWKTIKYNTIRNIKKLIPIWDKMPVYEKRYLIET